MRALFENAAHWRAGLADLGFELLPGEHPIIPVMLGDARLAQEMAAKLYEEGRLCRGLLLSGRPHGRARIQHPDNAALTTRRPEKNAALEAFATVRAARRPE